MGCYLEDYRARVGVWAGRVSCRASRMKARKQEARSGNIDLVDTILCAAVITALLVIGGVEQNPGPADNIVRVLCNGCDRNLNRGLNVTLVDSGIIIAVATLRFKRQSVGSGSVISVDR